MIGLGQNINTPDANSKSHLVVNTATKTNIDNEIRLIEANSLTGIFDLTCSSTNSYDLTVKKCFTKLTDLRYQYNFLTSSSDIKRNKTKNQPLLYFYNDGKVEKIITIN